VVVVVNAGAGGDVVATLERELPDVEIIQASPERRPGRTGAIDGRPGGGAPQCGRRRHDLSLATRHAVMRDLP
jgi:hypothetical protein